MSWCAIMEAPSPSSWVSLTRVFGSSVPSGTSSSYYSAGWFIASLLLTTFLCLPLSPPDDQKNTALWPVKSRGGHCDVRMWGSSPCAQIPRWQGAGKQKP